MHGALPRGCGGNYQGRRAGLTESTCTGWGCRPAGVSGEAVVGQTPLSLPLAPRLASRFQSKFSGSSGEGG